MPLNRDHCTTLKTYLNKWTLSYWSLKMSRERHSNDNACSRVLYTWIRLSLTILMYLLLLHSSSLIEHHLLRDQIQLCKKKKVRKKKYVRLTAGNRKKLPYFEWRWSTAKVAMHIIIINATLAWSSITYTPDRPTINKLAVRTEYMRGPDSYFITYVKTVMHQ